MNRIIQSLALALTVIAGAVYAAPEVSNRAATIDEVGYLPAPGDTPLSNPPALAWLNEPEATTWTVQIAQDAEFAKVDVEVTDWPYLLYTHSEPLQPGEYFWRYRFVNGKGEESDWSKVRDFEVTATATEFPRPSSEKLKQLVPTQHPRMFTRPEKAAQLRKDAVKGNAQFDALIKAADGYLKSPVMQEPKPWSDGKWNAVEWRTYLGESNVAARAMENLAFAWMLTGNEAYGARAKEHLVAYVQWDPLGPSSMKVNDEVGMPMLYSISRTYDWIHPLLSEEQKTQVRDHIRARGQETYARLRSKPYDQFAYNSHNGRMWHYLGEAGLSFYGEIPEAETWLNYAMTIFYGWYPAWGRGDGGWAEGIHYWSSYNVLITWWLDMMTESLGLQGGDKPFYSNVGDFPFYVCPPGNPVGGFGDFAERPPSPRTLAEPMSAFALIKGNGAWKWYADSMGADLSGRFINFIRAARPQPKAEAPVGLPVLKVFPQGGVATFNTDITSAAQNMHLAMRSSPFGNVSHSHNDQNAIVLSAYGKPLLVNTGTRDFYSSEFCKKYYWQTVSHNSVLFDGKGQQRGRTFTGKFVAYGEEKDKVAYAVGDATAAYPGLVDLYRRWAVMLPDVGVLLIDEVKTSASEMSLLFHGRQEFQYKKPVKNGEWNFSFGESDNHLPFNADFSLKYDDVHMVGHVFNLPVKSENIKFTQTDKYPLPLAANKEPLFDEWHLEGKVQLSGKPDETQRIMTLLTISKDEAKSSGMQASSNMLSFASMRDKSQVSYSGTVDGIEQKFKLELDFEKNTVTRLTE